MGLVEDDQLKIRQKIVFAALSRKSLVERLDGRNDDMEFTRRRPLLLLTPHSGDAEPRSPGTDARPHLSPRLHGLLAQFVPVRNPENATTETVIAASPRQSLAQ